MKREIKRILADYHKSLTAKNEWFGIYRPVYEYMMPHRYCHQDKKDVRIFSSLGEQVADSFVRKVQEMLTPVGQNWMSIEAGHFLKKQKNDVSAINKELEKVADILNVFKDTSNFDVVATEFYYDLILGTACLLISEGTKENPIRCTAIPVDKYSFEEGAFGEICAVYRDVSVKAEHIGVTWRDAKYTLEKGKEQDEVKLIECTYYDYDESIWRYLVIDGQKDTAIVEREYLSNPFVILRWTKFSGEIYGRGQGLKVIHDVQTHNKIKEDSLRALAFAIPVFLASQEGDYDVDDFVFEPGAINPVPSTLSTNPTITQLGVNQTPDLTAFHSEQLEMDIKKNMFDNTIPNDASRDITATEIAERAQDLAGNIINSFGRIKNEMLYPIHKRFCEILQKFGYISSEIDVRSFNGFGFQIKVNTALSNRQHDTEVKQMTSVLQLFSAFDPNMQFISKLLKMPEIAIELADKMGMPNKFINTLDEFNGLMEKEAQSVAQAQQAEQQRAVAVNTAIAEGEANAKARFGTN